MDNPGTNPPENSTNSSEAGNYSTLIDVILDYAGKVLQKLTRSSRTISFYWSAAFICLVVLIIGFGISVVLGELASTGVATMKILGFGVGLAYLSLIIFKNARNVVVEKIDHSVMEAITGEEDRKDLKNWLKLFANTRIHLIFCIIYAIVFWFGLREEFTGYGSSFIVLAIAFIWGIPMYFLLTFLLMPYRLGQYDFRLYNPDPGSSKIIFDLSRLLSGLVYLYAVVAFGSMVFIAYSGLLPSLALPSIVVAWVPIIALFILNQYALANIITKGKTKALREIQLQIENIQKQEDLAEKEIMEKVVRLMDYHDRIKGTKNAAFDLRAGLDFLNSLLLPVVGFFIGNIDINTIQEFFNKTGWLNLP